MKIFKHIIVRLFLFTIQKNSFCFFLFFQMWFHSFWIMAARVWFINGKLENFKTRKTWAWFSINQLTQSVIILSCICGMQNFSYWFSCATKLPLDFWSVYRCICASIVRELMNWYVSLLMFLNTETQIHVYKYMFSKHRLSDYHFPL